MSEGDAGADLGPAGEASADLPTAGDASGSDRGGGARLAFVIVGAAVVVVVIAVVVAAVVASRPSGYSDATRERFLTACTADGGPSVRDACRCIYDELAATVPYDRFVDVDEQLRAQLPSTPAGQPLSLPSDVAAVVESCRTAG